MGKHRNSTTKKAAQKRWQMKKSVARKLFSTPATSSVHEFVSLNCGQTVKTAGSVDLFVSDIESCTSCTSHHNIKSAKIFHLDSSEAIKAAGSVDLFASDIGSDTSSCIVYKSSNDLFDLDRHESFSDTMPSSSSSLSGIWPLDNCAGAIKPIHSDNLCAPGFDAKSKARTELVDCSNLSHSSLSVQCAICCCDYCAGGQGKCERCRKTFLQRLRSDPFYNRFLEYNLIKSRYSKFF